MSETHWISTYTGLRFHYLDPKPEEVDIRDIAHALSLKCRFSGMSSCFYSVGEHSIRVSDILPFELGLSGLLHDASEAYIPDIPRPIKEDFGLREFENKLLEVINQKFGVEQNDQVKEADNILLSTEARDLMSNTDGWMKLPEPLEAKIYPFQSKLVEVVFLARFFKYGGKYDQT